MNSLKIVIPTAGFATRMRPQTWTKPKPLVSVAGKPAIDHLLDTFKSVPAGVDVEYVIILGPHLGEEQIPPYMKEHHPDLKVHYVLQPVMKGQSDAFWLAREHLKGPLLMVFSDTLIETDFSFLANEKADGVAWVKSVPDPRRFGVAIVNQEGWVTELEEKPKTCDNTLVVVGCYYIKDSTAFVSAIEEQFRRKKEHKGEYFLVDAINILIEREAKIRTQVVETWLDTGTIDATLETNRYLLERRPVDPSAHANAQVEKHVNVKIVPPAFIHPTAEVKDAVIGPYASIGANCTIEDGRIENSILEERVTVKAAALTGSFIGRRAKVMGHSADAPPVTLYIGDDSSLQL